MFEILLIVSFGNEIAMVVNGSPACNFMYGSISTRTYEEAGPFDPNC